MEAIGERTYSSYSFTTLALDGVSGQRHAPAALNPQGKNPEYPLYRRLGGPQSRSRLTGYRQNPLPLPGIQPRSPGRPVRSQTLYWLSYPAPSLLSTASNIYIYTSGSYITNWRLLQSIGSLLNYTLSLVMEDSYHGSTLILFVE
jgi:hypothetical protein